MANSHFRIIDLILAACLIIPPASASDFGGCQNYASRSQVRSIDLHTHRPVFNSAALNLEAIFGNAKILPGSSGPHVKHQTPLGFVAAPVEEDPLWDLFTMGALIHETIWTTLTATHQEFLNALSPTALTEASLAKTLGIQQSEVLLIAEKILTQFEEYRTDPNERVRKLRPFEKQLRARGRPVLAVLNDREKDVVHWRLQGLRNREVAAKLRIGTQIVKNYIQKATKIHLMEKQTGFPLEGPGSLASAEAPQDPGSYWDRRLEEDPLWDLFTMGALIHETIWTTLTATHQEYLKALCPTTLTEASLVKTLGIEENEVLPIAEKIFTQFKKFRASPNGRVRKPWRFEMHLRALGRTVLAVVSNREKEVVQWRLQGLGNREVATKLAISQRAVENYIQNVTNNPLMEKQTGFPLEGPGSLASAEALQDPGSYWDRRLEEDPLWDLFTMGALIHETIWTKLPVLHRRYLKALCTTTLTEASLVKTLGIEENEVLPIAEKIFTQFKKFRASPNGRVRKPWPFEMHLRALGRPVLAIVSNREKEVVQWRLQGLGNKEVAEQMGISKHTVDNHLQNVTNIHLMEKQTGSALEGPEYLASPQALPGAGSYSALQRRSP